MARVARRWDGDKRGSGIAGGGRIVADVGRLVDALDAPHWVAEEPEHHLLAHLHQACDTPGSPWTLRSAEMVEAVYVLTLDWSRDGATMRLLRADAYALIGAIAESVSYIHQRVEAETVHYDVVSGMLAADTPFQPHGHLVELRIGGPRVAELCAGARVMPDSTE